MFCPPIAGLQGAGKRRFLAAARAANHQANFVPVKLNADDWPTTVKFTDRKIAQRLVIGAGRDRSWADGHPLTPILICNNWRSRQRQRISRAPAGTAMVAADGCRSKSSSNGTSDACLSNFWLQRQTLRPLPLYWPQRQLPGRPHRTFAGITAGTAQDQQKPPGYDPSWVTLQAA